MAYDQRKRDGVMCAHYSCAEMNDLHSIVRTCANGHRLVLRYCSNHIERMMEIALRTYESVDGGPPSDRIVCEKDYSLYELVTEML